MWVWKHLSIPRGDGAADMILALKVSHSSISHGPGADPTHYKHAQTQTHTPEPCLYLGGQHSSPSACCAMQGFITHCSSISFAKQHFQSRQDAGCAQARPHSRHGRLCRAQTQLGWQQPAHPGLCSHLPEPRQLLLLLASIHPSSSYSYCTYSFPRRILREHPLGARAFQHRCLGQPPSFPPSVLWPVLLPLGQGHKPSMEPRVGSSTVKCSSDSLSTEPRAPAGAEAAQHSPSSTARGYRREGHC